MLNNKRGLSSGLITIIVMLLIFGITALVANVVWTNYNAQIQAFDTDVISNSTKEDISDLGVFIGWGDKLFLWLFIALLAAYLISAATLPPAQPVFFLLFMAFLTVIVLTTMILSNAWTVIAAQPDFLAAIGELPITDYVFTYFPTITFFVGLLGAIIFFTRKDNGSGGLGGAGGGVDFE